MKINEKQKAQLKRYIKNLIKESVESMGGYSQFEGDYKKDYPHKGENEKKPLHNPDGTSDQNNENEQEELLRSSVEKFFKSNNTVGRKIDIAGYAYQLDGIKPTPGEDSNEMKNSRSLFMKKLNHEPNDQGYPYSFSTAEINRLASMISSNNTISEAVSSAIRKVVSEIGYHEKQYLANKPYDKKDTDRKKPEEMWSHAKKVDKRKKLEPVKGKEVDHKGVNPFDHMSDKIDEVVARAVRKTINEWYTPYPWETEEDFKNRIERGRRDAERLRTIEKQEEESKKKSDEKKKTKKDSPRETK